MATLKITIDMDNAAFQNDDMDGQEVASILRGFCHKINLQGLDDKINCNLYATNGNRVGQAVVEKD